MLKDVQHPIHFYVGFRKYLKLVAQDCWCCLTMWQALGLKHTGPFRVHMVSFVAVNMRCLVLRPRWRNRVGVGFHLTPCRRSRPHKSTPRILVVLSPHTEWLLQYLSLEDDETSSVWVVLVFQQILYNHSSWPHLKSTPVIAVTPRTYVLQ